jgi:hypothetical protein
MSLLPLPDEDEPGVMLLPEPLLELPPVPMLLLSVLLLPGVVPEVEPGVVLDVEPEVEPGVVLDVEPEVSLPDVPELLVLGSVLLPGVVLLLPGVVLLLPGVVVPMPLLPLLELGSLWPVVEDDEPDEPLESVPPPVPVPELCA